MITCLDIIVPGRSRKSMQNNNNQLQIGHLIREAQERQEPQLVEEQPEPADEAPIVDSHANELTATGIAGLAVVLLLAAALVAMSTMNKKQVSPVL